MSRSNARIHEPQTAQRRWPRIVVPIVLVLATVAVYSNTFRVPFLFDDIPSIDDNSTIRHLWRSFFPPNTADPTVAGRPVANVSLAINYTISELDTWSYHVFNLLVHIGSGLFLYGIIRRSLLLSPINGRIVNHIELLAGVVALLWLVHPIQTESVTYIVQRVESMVGMFFLGTLYCAIRAMTNMRSAGWTVVAFVLCALGMATKEVMAGAPLLVFLFDRTFVSGSFREALRRHRTMHLLLASTWVVLAALLIASPRAKLLAAQTEITSLDYLRTQGGAILRYFALSFWPHPLIFDYGPADHGVAVVRTFSEALAPMSIVAIVLGLAAWSIVRRSWLGFLGAWFFVILSPSSSLVPIPAEIIAEHRMYLPLAAVIALIVIAPCAISTNQRVRTTVVLIGGMLSIPLGAMTFDRNRTYSSDYDLWAETVARRPENVRARYNLGYVAGKMDRADEEMVHYHRAIEQHPNYPEAHNNLGNALFKKGCTAEAIEHLSRAIALRPEYPRSRYNLGCVLARLNRTDDAMEQFRIALQQDPNYAEAHNNLGNALVIKQRHDEAETSFRRAIEHKPELHEAHFNLANHLRDRGRFDEAVASYRRAIDLKREYFEAHVHLAYTLNTMGQPQEAIAEYDVALRLRPNDALVMNNMSIVLLEAPDPALRNSARAVSLAAKACDVTRRSEPNLLRTLARAQAATGDLPAAINAASLALELAQKRGSSPLVDDLLRRITLYRAGQTGENGLPDLLPPQAPTSAPR